MVLLLEILSLFSVLLLCSWLTSLITGWFKLAKKYPGNDELIPRRLVTISLWKPSGFRLFSRCSRPVYIAYDENGIGFRAFGVFTSWAGYSAIFIPWGKLNYIRRDKRWFRTYSILSVDDGPIAFLAIPIQTIPEIESFINNSRKTEAII